MGVAHPRQRRFCSGRSHREIFERLEPRLLLASYIINGTNGIDTWTIRAGTTGVTVNGVFFANPGTTDVQINGFGGNDFVTVTRATVPVVFNGGNENDTCNVGGGNVDEISALVTFIGGGSNIDTAYIQDNLYASNTTYNAGGFQADRAGLGRIAWDATCDDLVIDAGTGSNAIYINSLSSVIETHVFGTNAGSDAVNVDMTGAGAHVNVFGGAGPGVDSLALSDFNNPSAAEYSVLNGAIIRGSKVINYGGVESLILQGTGNASSDFYVQGVAPGTPTSLLGWSFADTFSVFASNGPGYTLPSNLTLTGFGGHDTFGYDASGYTGGVPAVFTVAPTTVSSTAHAGAVTYGDIESLTLYGPNNDSDFNVLGTSPLLVGSTTINAGNGSNDVTIAAYDGLGNFTLPTPVRVSGQNGTDSATVDATASNVGRDYVIYSLLGRGIVGGITGTLLDADSTVETIAVHTGAGNDTFDLDNFASGNAVSVNAGGGNDIFDIGSGSRSMPIAISNMAAFEYIGGTGADELNVYNQDHPGAWQYARHTSALAMNPTAGGGYFLNLLHFNTETIFLSGGALADAFTVTSALFGQKTVISAAGGLDDVAVNDFVNGDVEFAVSQDLNALTIGQSSRARMSSTDGTTLYLRSLSVAGRLDLRGNDLVIDYSSVSPVGVWTGSAYDGVTGMIKAAAVFSSSASGTLTTLGVAESRDAFNLAATQTATFSGQSVDATAVLVKFTWGGDANLDGKIDIDDYGQIDFNIAQPAPVRSWFWGDFNLDGKINIDDYGIIDFNVGAQDAIL